jgi:hypothetical protein
MKHVLPFKQRQVEQRQLEAEAEKQARIRGAEGNAQARRIEANGESDARKKLADAEAYRLESVGKVNAEQMAREGSVVTAHPLLIKKILAEKLSDKVQVIIAPPDTRGDVITAVLAGGPANEPLPTLPGYRVDLRARAGGHGLRGGARGDRGRRRGVPAPRAARFGQAARAAVAGRGGRDPRRAPRLPAGLGPPPRARGGFVSARNVRIVAQEPGGASELLAVVRFLRDSSGSEALGIGYAAAYVQAATTAMLRGPEGAEVLEALGTFAERLAQRASSGSATTKEKQAALTGHLEVALHYGIAFTTYERDGRMVVCYEGDAFRRVIELAATPRAAPGRRSR